MYKKYGEVVFELNGRSFKLNVYQSLRLQKSEGYEGYLFLPYTDLTNGNETYAGGRYIDLRIPSSDTLIIDFNMSYCPLCAHKHAYSCPIPPAENSLEIEIRAGVMNLTSKKQH